MGYQIAYVGKNGQLRYRIFKTKREAEAYAKRQAVREKTFPPSIPSKTKRKSGRKTIFPL